MFNNLSGLIKFMYDAIVVGAGPAGSSAARVLEERKRRVLLMDKEIMPRSKPCAGVLSPKIRSLTDMPEDVYERPLKGYRVFAPSGRKVETTFPDHGYIVRRSIFDYHLLRALAERPLHAKAEEVVNKGDHLEVVTDRGRKKGKYVIGADGAASVVGRYCGMKMGRKALAAQYVLGLSAEAVDERVGDWFEVFYVLNHGYGWISPLKEGLKVGVGIVTDQLRGNIWDVLEDFMGHPLVEKKCRGAKVVGKQAAPIPMSGPPERLAGDRALLAGDAGGFVYPGTGEGIFYAMRSGRVAGETVCRALDGTYGDDPGCEVLSKEYSEELERIGLLALRDVDFVDRVLSTAENREGYVRRLAHLAGPGSSF